MIVEKIVGVLQENETRTVDYVDIEWFEAFKRLHKKVTTAGEGIGLRLQNEILTRGLREGDVLYEDENHVIAVRIPKCEAMVITAAPGHDHALVQAVYEIGNTHGTLFWGEREREFITPVNDPLMEKLEKIHGITVEKRMVHFDFDKAISSSVNDHHH